jgi:TonB family protein
LVQRLDYYEAQRSNPSQATQSYISDSSVLTDDLLAEYSVAMDEYVVVSDPPRAIYTFAPRYPTDAELAMKESTVWISALVLQDGYVGEARVAQPSGTDFDFERAALEAAMLYTYSPARFSDQKVDCWVTYAVQFRLKKP